MGVRYQQKIFFLLKTTFKQCVAVHKADWLWLITFFPSSQKSLTGANPMNPVGQFTLQSRVLKLIVQHMSCHPIKITQCWCQDHWIHLVIAQLCMDFTNTMAPGVCKSILLNSNLGSKNFFHVRFSRKRGLKPLKIAFFII